MKIKRMKRKPPYSDLEKYIYWDECSQFTPGRRWVYGCEYYEVKITCFIPARLLRRAPDLIDEFMERHHEDWWFYA
jgi:hypothetical protein